MKTIIYFISSIFLMYLLTSCGKDDDGLTQASGSILPKKIVFQYGDVLIYNYDGNKIKNVSTEDGEIFISFTYIGNNITKLEWVMDDVWEGYSYSNNKLTQSKVYSDHGLEAIYDYTYNSDGTVDVKQSNGNGQTVDWKRKYYDSKGNMIKEEDFRYTPHPYTSFVYDTKNSPYKNVTGYNIILGDGPNNLISSTHHDVNSGTTHTQETNTYEYNDKGYPTKCTSIIYGDSETIYFHY